MGRAVVATPKAAEGLEVIHGEHIVIAESDDAFVAETLDLLRKPDRRRALARNGRALIERRYSWQVAERIMAEETILGVALAAGKNGSPAT
jgi:glycosyltransferase involved in cell wall biosynthesis